MSDFIFKRLLDVPVDNFHKNLALYSSKNSDVYECAYLLGLSAALGVVHDFCCFDDVKKETVRNYSLLNSLNIRQKLILIMAGYSSVDYDYSIEDYDFIDRMVVENNDIDGKIERLSAFLEKLDSGDEKDMLLEQLKHMEKYKGCLEKRIDFYTKSNDEGGI